MAHPFQALDPKKAPKSTTTDFNKDDDKFIIEYDEIDVIKKTGEKETDFILDKKTVESSRINRQEYINSFRGDVGIMNILEKVRLTGDATLLDQTKRSPVPSEKTGRGNLEEIVDISNIPNSFIQADECITKGHDLFKDLPADLKGKLSFEDFVVKSPELYEKYIAAVKESAAKKESE